MGSDKFEWEDDDIIVLKDEKGLTQLFKAEWNEEDHPRDDDGKFTESGGGGGGATEKPAAEAKPAEEKPAAATPASKKPKSVKDFTDDGVNLDPETLTNPAKQRKFLEMWEREVGGADPGEFHQQFTGGIKSTMRIKFSTYGNSMQIQGSLLGEQGDVIGEYDREIDFGTNAAESAYFKIYNKNQGKGIGKQLLRANVETYQKLGLDKVDVSANIDVGGYAWARYGYVPTRSDWTELSGMLEGKIEQMSGGGGGYAAGSWEEMNEAQQERGEREFLTATLGEFNDSEIENWRESGQALDDAKVRLTEDTEFWIRDAVGNLAETRRNDGRPPFPFTGQQLAKAIEVSYDSDGEGRGDLDISFNDRELTQAQGVDPDQETLPGITPVVPHELLTKEMRDEITEAVEVAFITHAESSANDAEPPESLEENAREYQKEHWDSMEERDRFEWLRRHAPNIIGEGDGESEGTGEIDAADAAILLDLTRSSDPKSLWEIADSQWGQKLLLNSNWHGVLNLKDADTMARFNAYVGKAKAAA